MIKIHLIKSFHKFLEDVDIFHYLKEKKKHRNIYKYARKELFQQFTLEISRVFLLKR